MSTASLAHPHGAGVSRLRINRLGLWAFIISEVFLFSGLISARYYLAGLSRPPELNQVLGLGITTVLLLSSFFAYRAEMFAAGGNRAGFLRNTVFTLLLGMVFLVGVTIEWAEAFHAFPPDMIFGTIFFTLTGIHAFHVVSGLAVLLFVLLAALRGRQYDQHDYWPVEGAAKYWHFVDLAWVVIYPTLYLVG